MITTTTTRTTTIIIPPQNHPENHLPNSKMEETTRKASRNSFKSQATMVDLHVTFLLSVFSQGFMQTSGEKDKNKTWLKGCREDHFIKRSNSKILVKRLP